MIVSFFFAPALEDSAEGSRSGPQASARTADEVAAGSEKEATARDPHAAGVLPAPLHAEPARTPRDLTDIFFDSIKATVEAFDGR